VIQTSSMGSATLSADAAAARLRNAPQWFLRRVNDARQLRGLATIDVKKPVSPPVRGTLVAAPPAAKIAPVALPAALPRIGFILVGAAAGSTAGRIEAFSDTAFDGWLARARRGSRSVDDFVIRARGHGSPAVANAAGGSIQFRCLPLVGAAAIWRPDPKNPAHRAAVDAIAAGTDSCSVEIRVLRAEIVDNIRIIQEVEPAGIAILRAGERPAYAGSICGLLPAGETESAGLARLAEKSFRRGLNA
jgi:hypothetical protein